MGLQSIVKILSILNAGFLFLIAINALVNFFTWPRLRIRDGKQTHRPFLSVLIPARNEAANLPSTLASWMEQSYDRMEILVLDDHSEDETAAIVHQFGQRDGRIRLLSSAPLPTGWTGKNWACHQLAQASRGEFLLFTDADVRWEKGAIEAVLASQAALDADLLAIWPTQETISWGERLIIPLIPLAVTFYLPIPAAHHIPHPALAAAIGQAMLFRREAYEKIGGHAAIAANPLDDITLARRIKAAGLRLRLVEADRLIICRMYRSWNEVRKGIARSLLATAQGHNILLLASTLLQVFLFTFPWLGLASQGIWHDPVVLAASLLSLILVGIARCLSARLHHQAWQDCWLMPLSILLLVWIALQAIFWHARLSGLEWKERIVPLSIK